MQNDSYDFSNNPASAGMQNDSSRGFARPPKRGKPWLWPVLIILVLCVAFTVWISFAAVKGIQKAGVDFQSLLMPDFSELEATPKHDIADFATVIEVPNIKSLAVWFDSAGRHCLAARRGTGSGFSGGQEVIIFDSSLQESSRVSFEQSSFAAMNDSIAVGDVDGDGIPEIFADVTAKGIDSVVVGMDLNGNRFYESQPFLSGTRGIFLIESPATPGQTVLMLTEFFKEPRLVSMPGGNIDSAGLSHLRTHANLGGMMPEDPALCDWDGDGRKDMLFFGRDSSFNSTVTPYVDGKLLPTITLDKDFDMPLFNDAIAVYRDAGGGEQLLFAGIENPDFDFSGSLMGMPRRKKGEAAKLFWAASGGAVKGEIELKTNDYLFSGVVELADVTGDGRPEICAAISKTEFAIYDVSGAELYKKKLFDSRVIYGIGYIVSGDFDGDGKIDIAFRCANGIFIPDMSAIRK